MLRISLPCSPFKEEELYARKDILESCLGKNYPIGLELCGKWKDFFDLESLKNAEKNLKKFRKEAGENFFFSLHAPIKVEDIASDTFGLENNKGFEDFSHILAVAERFGASLVNFHAPVFSEVLPPKEESASLVEKQIKKVSEYVSKADFKGIICLENIPACYDPGFGFGVGFNNLEDFKNLPGGVFATVDLCHLATLSNDLVKEMEKIAPIIKEIHFNDGKTGSDGFEGGLVPGEGDISIRVFKEEITPFLKKLSDVNIVIEVLREDFISSDNSKKTLEKLAKWLDIF
ncbi:MAG: hypothetical protein A2365_00695 [Candidatus Nealsonbacteria bacterium RIFOXYB1_FULL_40_15]|uniref:Xylose isomerase-like TIM barrel domain-containing protein n=2 Tax=Candidatus Nealsoniibacteriota TaxID=1817911 RepID=A0A1G2ESV8_9BACT|nr:MAG: hypothetical protein A2365_00695 [Candidatus Nealsonbacteria bacterium RIFOXYB1_FULL_40_15]OGZ28787.1 MAG: hypothetical protein A2427_01875 [Candidatus Nealsonbacteria bacterium RIFOXYC1_FULL_40_7]OGZ29065.1 MAG: hypothetical protein A2562_01130 [Candidatus Nealsonbacteria bacterium RIFOXYD1_FULL_39_11]